MIRRRLNKSPSVEKLTEQRNLEWLPLAPPDYLVDQDYLINRFVEREILYYGTLNNIPNESEVTRRNEVLRLIDNGLKSHQLIQTESVSIISISAQNVKFNKRSIPETLILRIPMELIKSVAYVKDNFAHYVAFLHGTLCQRNSPAGLNCTVMATESRIKAEEICSLINQCFQIIYTEATIHHFDSKVIDTKKSNTVDPKKNLTSEEKEKALLVDKQAKRLGKESKNSYDFESVYSDLSSSKADFLQVITTLETLSNAMEETMEIRKEALTHFQKHCSKLVHNFMKQLTNVLQKEEMKRFAECLSAWQQGGLFETFCSQMKQLLGPNRIGILANMKGFIDPADWFTLEQFLYESNPQSNSCSPLGNWSQLIAKSPMPPFQMQRSISYASTSNGVLSIHDEENSFRDDFSSPVRNAYSNNPSGPTDNQEFDKAIDALFNKIGDLEIILSCDK